MEDTQDIRALIATNRQQILMNDIGNTQYLIRRQVLSSLIDPRHDMDAECGYLPQIGPDNYRQMFDREGVGTRITSMLPDDCWEVPPDVTETDDVTADTEFDKAVKQLDKDQNVFHYLHRLDVMSKIGHFGVLVIGLKDGMDLSQPAKGFDPKTGLPTTPPEGMEITFMRPFDETLVRVSQWESDVNNPRFSQPTLYRIQFFDPRTERPEGTGMAIASYSVHWTRVIHAADNRLSSETFGTPEQKNVFNYLANIRKILGGSAEMFWKGGFPGLSFEVDPTMGDTTVPLDAEKLKHQVDQYMAGLSRYFATAGMTVKSLAPQIADPTPSLRAQFQAICIAKGIPIIKLLGSEKGGLATNDDDTQSWNRKLARRQAHYISPWLVRPAFIRFMQLGVLPTVPDLCVNWQDLNETSDADIADTCLKLCQALSAFMSGGCDAMIPPAEALQFLFKFTQEQIEQIEKSSKKFAGVDENRNMDLGLNPDGTPKPSPATLGPDGKPVPMINPGTGGPHLPPKPPATATKTKAA